MLISNFPGLAYRNSLLRSVLTYMKEALKDLYDDDLLDMNAS